MWNRIKDFIKKHWLVLLVTLLLLSLVHCENQGRLREKQNVEALNSELSTYKLKNGQLVSSIKVVQYDRQQLRDQLEKDRVMKEMSKQFSEPKTITKIITVTKFDTIRERYTDSIPITFERRGFSDDPNHSYTYFSNQNGFELNDVSIPDTTRTVGGIKRRWFLGKETLVMDTSHTNPYVQDLGVSHVEVVQKKKWYESPVVIFVLGAAAGIIIAK